MDNKDDTMAVSECNAKMQRFQETVFGGRRRRRVKGTHKLRNMLRSLVAPLHSEVPSQRRSLNP